MQNQGLGIDNDEICEDSAAKNTTTYSANLPKSAKTFGILLKKALIESPYAMV